MGQVLLQSPGGSMGVALAELVHEQLVLVAPPVVLTGIRIEQSEADPHAPPGAGSSPVRARISTASAIVRRYACRSSGAIWVA